MQKLILSIAVFLVLATLVSAQDLITAKDVIGTETTEQTKTYRLDIDGDGTPDIDNPSDPVIIDSKEVAAKLITIDSLAANIRLSVEDSNRRPIVAKKLSNSQYLLTKPGRYWVRVTAIDFAANIFDEQTTIVELGTPEPSPPVEPSLMALIIYETSDVPRYVGNIIASPIIRNYLRGRCVKNSDGAPQFRFVDQDSRFTSCNDPFWCESLERAKGKGPRIVLSNGKDKYEGELPKSVSDTMKLLKKYGG